MSKTISNPLVNDGALYYCGRITYFRVEHGGTDCCKQPAVAELTEETVEEMERCRIANYRYRPVCQEHLDEATFWCQEVGEDDLHGLDL